MSLRLRPILHVPQMSPPPKEQGTSRIIPHRGRCPAGIFYQSGRIVVAGARHNLAAQPMTVTGRNQSACGQVRLGGSLMACVLLAPVGIPPGRRCRRYPPHVMADGQPRGECAGGGGIGGRRGWSGPVAAMAGPTFRSGPQRRTAAVWYAARFRTVSVRGPAAGLPASGPMVRGSASPDRNRDAWLWNRMVLRPGAVSRTSGRQAPKCPM